MTNYQNAVIYKLCCKDINISEIYIGSTSNMRIRKSVHKNICNNTSSRNYNSYVYKFIRENGGFINWYMILLEKYPTTDKKSLEARERYWIELLKSKLNTLIPSLTLEEKKVNHKEGVKKWYIENKNSKKIYMKTWINNNPDKIIINYNKRKEKIYCECGSYISHRQKAIHYKSKKHIEWEKIYNYINS